MRVIVSECVRYFEKPLCFRMVAGHVHTSRCWDQEFHELREELANVESDLRALEQANKLLKQENFKLKEQIKPSSTTSGGMRGPRHSWVSIDEAAKWNTDTMKAMYDEYGRLSEQRKTQREAKDFEVPGSTIRHVMLPDGRSSYVTPDGKRFDRLEQAQKHAVLLNKRP